MHFFNLEWNEAENIPVTIYRVLMDQALNLGALQFGGKFELSSQQDQQDKAMRDIARLKKEGRWKK